jgi:replicative DNA helicase
MVVIGARPKMGKTQLAVKMADYMARQESLPIIIFSMEMPKEQIFERFLTNGAKVSGNNFYQEMEDYDYSKISSYVGDVMDKKLFIDDRPSLSLGQIKSTCRRFKEEHGELGVIFVDYFTLIKIEGAGRTDLAFGANSTGLKDLAKELGAPVVLLAQLSRKVESRPSKRPIMSDLRESGSIEQDADLILFLYRESVYEPDSPLGGLTELIAAANRHGGSGTAFLEMKGGWFEDVSDNQVNHAYSDN